MKCMGYERYRLGSTYHGVHLVLSVPDMVGSRNDQLVIGVLTANTPERVGNTYCCHGV